MDFVTASTGLISPYWMGLPIRYIQYKRATEEPSLVAVEVNDDIGSSNTGCIRFKLNGMRFEFNVSVPDKDIQRIIKICLSL